MNLYERDYRILRPREAALLKSLKDEEARNRGRLCPGRGIYHRFTKPMRHHESLFPNNFLDYKELRRAGTLKAKIEAFSQKLDEPAASESSLQGFIRSERAYFIIGSIIKWYYNFGHHDAYLFPEFPLGSSYKVDYLIAGRSSDGFEFVFVELESPMGRTVQKDGELGSSFRSGIKQVERWRRWLGRHFPSLTPEFEKHCRQAEDLPSEFLQTDPSRYHFAVVAGRRTHFHPETYAIRRERRRDHLLLHYDNIRDDALRLIGESTY